MVIHATKSFVRLLFLVFITNLINLGVCTAKPREGIKSAQESQITQDEYQAQEHQQFLVSAEHYLKLAETAAYDQVHEYQLMAADMYAQAGNTSQAISIVDKVPNQNAAPNLDTLQKIILAEVAVQDENPQLAQTHLGRIQSRRTLSRSQQTRVLYLQTKTYEQTRQYFLAAKTRAELDKFLPDHRSQSQNRQAILTHLSKLSPSRLSHSVRNAEYPFSGWLSLAYIKKMTNPRAYKQLLNDWMRDYPSHPGHQMISNRQQNYGNGFNRNPRYHQSSIRHVALLLPLSGPHANAARAIREGYLAAYYENSGNIPKPSIKVYDTGNDVVYVYNRAIREGADFVVGPLMKDDVYRLSQTAHSIRTPILALNEHPGVNPYMRSFVQFSLAPEEEADQIVEKAKQSGFNNASIVVPDNNWGKRLANRFNTKWENAGGNIVSLTRVDPNKDMAQKIRVLLGIEQSQKRCSAIKRSIKEKVEYQLRRREDIDVIFMALPSDQARQVKPLFDFYYAQDIPILATSSIYAGNANPGHDRDINGVQFIDMPWIIDPKKGGNVRELISRYHGNQLGESSRLFAMGVDAYKLTLSFNKMQQSGQSTINGATGLLTLGSDNRVDRKMSWAKISNGSAKLMH